MCGLTGKNKNHLYRYSMKTAISTSNLDRSEWNNLWKAFQFKHFEDETEKMEFLHGFTLEDGATIHAPQSQMNRYRLVQHVIEDMNSEMTTEDESESEDDEDGEDDDDEEDEGAAEDLFGDSDDDKDNEVDAAPAAAAATKVSVLMH